MRIDIRFIKDKYSYTCEVKSGWLKKWKLQGHVYGCGSGETWMPFSSIRKEELIEDVLRKKGIRRDQATIFDHGVINII